MSASLGDMLTAVKNGVVALGNISQHIQTVANYSSFMFGFNRLAQAALTTSYVTLYTCPANQRACVTNITVCNTNNTNSHLYLSIVPQNGTAGTGNSAFYNFQISAHDTQIFQLSLPMNALDTLQAKASATGVTIFISGGATA